MPSFMDVFRSDASAERRRELEQQKEVLQAKRDSVEQELDRTISRAEFLAEPLTVDRLREQISQANRPRTARIMGGDVAMLGGDMGPLEDPTINVAGDEIQGMIDRASGQGPGQVRFTGSMPAHGMPYLGEQMVDEALTNVANRILPGGPYDFRRSYDSRDFSFYPMGDAAPPFTEVPKTDAAGNLTWGRNERTEDPRGPAVDRPAEIAPMIADEDRLDVAPSEETPTELPTDAEIDALMEQMPTQEGRSWLGKIRDHVKRNWKKYAAGGAMAVGAKLSEDFREGLTEVVEKGLDYQRALGLARAKKPSKAGQKIEGNRIVSYGPDGEILAMHDLGTTPKEIRTEVKDYTKSAPYKKILDAKTNWNKLEASVDANNPIGDIGAMFGFISGLDDTAVRDGERAMILGAGSLASKIKFYLGMEEDSRGYIDGRQLTQEQLQGMKEISRQFYESEIETFRGYREDYIKSIGATDPRTNYDEFFQDPTRDFVVGGGGGEQIRTLSTGKRVKKVNGQWVEVR